MVVGVTREDGVTKMNGVRSGISVETLKMVSEVGYLQKVYKDF